MLKTSVITVTLAISAALQTTAADMTSDSIPAVNLRIDSHSSMLWRETPLSYSNPALKQWMLPISYSTISAGYHSDKSNRPVNVQLGSGNDYWSAGADSYIKHRGSTLWGNASYRNGHIRSVNWNESSDAELIYPYFTADSVGGDMNMESYSFAGGYAGHSGRWAWGGTIGYHAGLYYRNVDPRPRNVTGRLDISAGAAIRIGGGAYYGGLSVNYRKYKQTCDIEFINEMSDNRIWHLTGLGTHYERFEAKGYSHYYDGNRWGTSIGIFPSTRRGAVVSAGFSSFRFDHILTALNKLPLQSARENRLDAEAGWLAPGKTHDWSAMVNLTHGKRSGTENLFGDPAADVFPQIGSLDMYTHTFTAANLNLLWQWHPRSGYLLCVRPSVTYSRSRETYADPHRHLQLASITPAVLIKGALGLGSFWRGELSLRYAMSAPAGCDSDMPINNTVPAGMQLADINRYDILSKPHSTVEIEADISRAINHRYALMLAIAYRHGSFTTGIQSDYLDISLSLIF